MLDMLEKIMTGVLLVNAREDNDWSVISQRSGSTKLMCVCVL
jgi:hypothetical protein